MDNAFIKYILDEVYGYYTKELLNEAKDVTSMVGVFRRNNPGIDADELAQLMMCDPTAVSNDRGDFVGKYATWIGNRYVAGDIGGNDIQELQAALKTYDINKSQLPKDIRDVRSFEELCSLVEPYDNSFRAGRTIGKAERELEKIFEDDNFVVYIPHTWEADRRIGGDTRWCTAADNDGEYFDQYLNEYGGCYYVIIRKSDGAKFQLHVESEQLNNRENKLVNFNSICSSRKEFEPLKRLFAGLGKDIREWIPKAFPDELPGLLASGRKPKDIFDQCGRFSEGYAVVKFCGKCNFIGKDGRLLSDQWFDWCGNFSEGYARVQFDEKYNFIGRDRQYLSKQWFDDCDDFREGYAMVQLGEKYNFIGRDNQFVSNQWFDDCGTFSEGYVVVRIGGKWNFIGKDRRFLSNQWFDDCYKFQNGYAVVRLGEKYNFIGRDKQFLSDQWFDCCDDFEGGYAVVRIDEKYYLLGTDGQLYDRQ